MRVRRRSTVLLAIAAAAVLVVLLTREIWLQRMGDLLVRNDQPGKADAILVLGGDFTGKRIMTACQLAAQGYAPIVLVSGPMDFYGINEADLAIRYASERGCRTGNIQPLYMTALSTTEEAREYRRALRERGIHDVLIVTSNFHTARAGFIFERQLGHEVRVRMVPAPYQYFTQRRWWSTREGQKTVFYEYCKVLAAATGI